MKNKSKSAFVKMGAQPMPKGGKSYRTGDDLSYRVPKRKKFAGVSAIVHKRNLAVE